MAARKEWLISLGMCVILFAGVGAGWSLLASLAMDESGAFAWWVEAIPLTGILAGLFLADVDSRHARRARRLATTLQ